MSSTSIAPVMADQYREEGYFIAAKDAELEAKGIEQEGLTRKGNRYFIANMHRKWRSRILREFLFDDLMADVCRATIGDTAYLFHEQFVVQGADQGTKFSRHQDSGYLGSSHAPYVTVWTTLDDVTVENGTVYILPYSKAGTREFVKHVDDPKLHDRIGYAGEEEGIPVEIPAGSLAVFSSLVFHRSGANTTPRTRRVYLPQYSTEPIVKPGGEIHAFADPFLIAGAVQP